MSNIINFSYTWYIKYIFPQHIAPPVCAVWLDTRPPLNTVPLLQISCCETYIYNISFLSVRPLLTFQIMHLKLAEVNFLEMLFGQMWLTPSSSQSKAAVQGGGSHWRWGEGDECESAV